MLCSSLYLLFSKPVTASIGFYVVINLLTRVSRTSPVMVVIIVSLQKAHQLCDGGQNN